MSIIGKGSGSYKKQDVQEQKSVILGGKKLRFAHKATAGDTGINLTALVLPPEMAAYGFANPSPAALGSASLNKFRANLKLISSVKGLLIDQLSYSIGSAVQINFLDFAAEDGEIFTGLIDDSPIPRQDTGLDDRVDALEQEVANLDLSGGGEGLKNYIVDGDAENGAAGWDVYADAAAAAPVDGTSGSSVLTVTTSAVNPLSGAESFILTKGALDTQGQGWSYDFEVDLAAQAKVLNISFDYLVNSGTFVAGSSNLLPSDVTVWLYDVTNSVLIQPSTIYLGSNNTTLSEKFSSTFQTSPDATQYRLIFHVGTTSADAYSLKIDNLAINPSNYAYGTPITDWQIYTPTGSWVSNATYIGRWRRVGDTMEVQGLVTTGGLPTAATLTFGLPAGHVVDTTKIAYVSGEKVVGLASILDFGTSSYPGFVRYATTSTVSVFAYITSGSFATNSPVNSTTPFTFAMSDTVNVEFAVPIMGWSSSVQMSDNADTRAVAAYAYLTADQSGLNPNNSGVKVNFNTVAPSLSSRGFDTHGAFNTSTFRYVVPVSGLYDVFGIIRLVGTNVLADVYNALLYVNGVSTIAGDMSNATVGTEFQRSITAKLNLRAGDYLELYLFGRGNNSASTLTVQSGNGSSYLTVSKISGPSAIAANETINLAYTSTAGTSIASGATGMDAVPFATKVVDTHNAWNGTTFTAPISGKYKVICNAGYASAAWTGLSTYSIALRKNGTVARFLAVQNKPSSASYEIFAGGSTEIDLIAGDTLTIRMQHNEAGARSLTVTGEINYLCISRTGN